MEQGLLPKGPLDPGPVLEGSLRYNVLKGQDDVTTREPARYYCVVSTNYSINCNYYFYGTITCQVLR